MPLINENDTVATDEIRFGDNDRLAARVAAMVSADTLVLLSDIDGLYSADPRSDPKARLIPEVHEISAEIEAMAAGAAAGYGTGGMVTKLAAARIALAAGCRMVIADGHRLHPLAQIDRSPDAPGSCRRHRRRRRASAGSPAPSTRPAASPSTPAPRALWPRARACFRPASSPSTANSTRARPSSSGPPTVASSAAA